MTHFGFGRIWPLLTFGALFRLSIFVFAILELHFILHHRTLDF